MAINQNHTVEELNGIKCSVVEKKVSKERADFLKTILTYNNYAVEIATSPPAKIIAAKPTTESEETIQPIIEEETFTVGVTDLMFNSINAIFGRLLKTNSGKIVTLNYWEQKETISNDEIPYYENKS